MSKSRVGDVSNTPHNNPAHDTVADTLPHHPDAADPAELPTTPNRARLAFTYDLHARRWHTLEGDSKTLLGLEIEALRRFPMSWQASIIMPPRDVLVDAWSRLSKGQPVQHVLQGQPSPQGDEGRWLKLELIPRLDSQGQLIALGGLVEDITPPRQREQRSKLGSFTLIFRLLEEVSDGLWVISRDKTLSFFNQDFSKRITRRTGREPVLRAPFVECLSGDERDVWEDRLSYFLEACPPILKWVDIDDKGAPEAETIMLPLGDEDTMQGILCARHAFMPPELNGAKQAPPRIESILAPMASTPIPRLVSAIDFARKPPWERIIKENRDEDAILLWLDTQGLVCGHNPPAEALWGPITPGTDLGVLLHEKSEVTLHRALFRAIKSTFLVEPMTLDVVNEVGQHTTLTGVMVHLEPGHLGSGVLLKLWSEEAVVAPSPPSGDTLDQDFSALMATLEARWERMDDEARDVLRLQLSQPYRRLKKIFKPQRRREKDPSIVFALESLHQAARLDNGPNDVITSQASHKPGELFQRYIELSKECQPPRPPMRFEHFRQHLHDVHQRLEKLGEGRPPLDVELRPIRDRVEVCLTTDRHIFKL